MVIIEISAHHYKNHAVCHDPFPPLFLALEHPPNGNANVHYAMYASPLKNAECIFFWCVGGAWRSRHPPSNEGVDPELVRRLCFPP